MSRQANSSVTKIQALRTPTAFSPMSRRTLSRYGSVPSRTWPSCALSPPRPPLRDPLMTSRPQPGRHLLVRPVAQRVQRRAEVGIHLDIESLGSQQPLDAVATLRLLLLQILQAPVPLPAVLIRHRGHVHHAKDLALAAVVAAQQVQELGRVHRIALDVLAPP